MTDLKDPPDTHTHTHTTGDGGWRWPLGMTGKALKEVARIQAPYWPILTADRPFDAAWDDYLEVLRGGGQRTSIGGRRDSSGSGATDLRIKSLSIRSREGSVAR
ncbi:hypothetical protein FOA52_011999 [Chlamydomonas sp. UWO 241]|nr:hypothetical protein FOA52_011999 [Chlamydomonas sp. UWO 241]